MYSVWLAGQEWCNTYTILGGIVPLCIAYKKGIYINLKTQLPTLTLVKFAADDDFETLIWTHLWFIPLSKHWLLKYYD